MSNQAVAKRYAKALFDIGTEQGKVDVFAASMADLKNLIETNDEVKDVLSSHFVSLTNKKELMRKVLANEDEIVVNTVSVVIDKNRADDLVAICEAYQILVEEAANIAHATVKSAVPLTEEQINKIEAKFSSITGQTVKTKVIVDESLIGGVSVTIGDKVYDGSVAHQIEKMAQMLKN